MSDLRTRSAGNGAAAGGMLVATRRSDHPFSLVRAVLYGQQLALSRWHALPMVPSASGARWARLGPVDTLRLAIRDDCGRLPHCWLAVWLASGPLGLAISSGMQLSRQVWLVQSKSLYLGAWYTAVGLCRE